MAWKPLHKITSQKRQQGAVTSFLEGGGEVNADFLTTSCLAAGKRCTIRKNVLDNKKKVTL